MGQESSTLGPIFGMVCEGAYGVGELKVSGTVVIDSQLYEDR